MKPLWPIVDEVKDAFEKLQSLSNDELRAKTAEFKQKIADHIAEEKAQVAASANVWDGSMLWWGGAMLLALFGGGAAFMVGRKRSNEWNIEDTSEEV